MERGKKERREERKNKRGPLCARIRERERERRFIKGREVGEEKKVALWEGKSMY